MCVYHLTVGHAGVCAAVGLNQLSVDGSLHQLKLQLIWSCVSIAHCELLTAYTHTHTHTQEERSIMRDEGEEGENSLSLLDCKHTHSHKHVSFSSIVDHQGRTSELITSHRTLNQLLDLFTTASLLGN